MSEEKIFYRANLCAEPEGLVVYIEKWFSIHETKCMHFCVKNKSLCSTKKDGAYRLKSAKSIRSQVKRIHKSNSRFAFDTVEQAIDNLRYRKRKQIRHLERDLAFAQAFLDSDLNDESRILSNGDYPFVYIPDTGELVSRYLIFC